MKRMRGATEYAVLLDAIDRHRPACHDDDRYVTDDLPNATRAELAHTCQSCPILTPCAAYARAARPAGGHWPGINRSETK